MFNSLTSQDTNVSNSIRITGRVSVTFPERGFFWIEDGEGKRYFAHQAKVRLGFSIFDMWEGQACSFESKPDPQGRGLTAINIEMSNA